MRDDIARTFQSAEAKLVIDAEAIEWDVLITFVIFGVEGTVINEFVPVPTGLTKVPIVDLRPVTYYSAWRAERQELADEFNQAFKQTEAIEPSARN